MECWDQNKEGFDNNFKRWGSQNGCITCYGGWLGISWNNLDWEGTQTIRNAAKVKGRTSKGETTQLITEIKASTTSPKVSTGNRPIY